MELDPHNGARSLHAAATTIASLIQSAASRYARPFITALDGGSGAGKTTLALLAAERLADLHLATAIVHIDDFFDAAVSDEQWDRCTDEQKCLRCMDWQRLKREALLPLLDGRAASYRPFSFDTQDHLAHDAVTVQPAAAILLDGIYGTLPELMNVIDLSILIQVPPEIRRRRHNERENSEDIEWHRRWDPAEDYYFSRLRPPSSFDHVIQLA
ncbi:hypothetical protein GZH47_30465 [Paenibacillus rhizovicinus]|uniref:Phosphoribulokinase/uridine kinase domain-containing protein n=1 Tax=Paenibacillus rhizovicinus TaxID=2704463 RepID=A0A6C0P8J3_9BACL|nr:hypothetical protein [Paenibacillus rhizovicinus]QHW34695.1 hypothetical protein GZH47_30465 [Paenibacillus rhizovicinus]